MGSGTNERRWSRSFLYIGLPVGVLAAAAMTARAFDTSWIAAGQTISAAQLKANLDEVQARLAALEAGADCPQGYIVAKKPYVTGNADSVQCKNGNDLVVKVGRGASAFWVDQYESSIWNTPAGGTQYGLADLDAANVGFPLNGQWTTPMYALSVAGVLPSRFLSWFQANEACRMGGKRLPTGDEWLAAAGGTIDPGVNTGSTGCNTSSGVVRMTGGGVTNCVSRWGAEDMIGNAREWTNEWYAAPGTGSAQAPTVTNWPSGYGGVATCTAGGGTCGDDITTNVNDFTNVGGLPAAAVRGGNYTAGAAAGIFHFDVGASPTVTGGGLGFRCVIR